MRGYLASLAAAGELLPPRLGRGSDWKRRADRLERCGAWLKLHDYYQRGQTRLVDGMFCGQHLLCPLCAIRRGSKLLRAYVEKLLTVLHECPDLRPHLVTLTVRDGADLGERFTHLRRAVAKLMDRRRKYLNGQSCTWSEAVGALAGVGSLEVKRGKGSGQWHPHYHAVWLTRHGPDQAKLSAEWHELTGDSFVVDVRPFHCADQLHELAGVEKLQAIAGDFVEVAKYALKFGELTLPDNVQAFRLLCGRRLVDSFGFLRGVEIDDSLLEEPIEDRDEPYLEILAKFCGKLGRYELEDVRSVFSSEMRADVELDQDMAEAVALAEASFLS